MRHNLVGNASVKNLIPNCSTIPYTLSCPASVVVLAAQTTQHYSKIVMDSSAPVDRGSKEETFTALTADFGFHDKVTALFLKSPMENLEDFRYYFADEKEIDAFVAADHSLKGPEARIQIARVETRMGGSQAERPAQRKPQYGFITGRAR